MEDTILEKEIEDYPCMISLAKANKIIYQMENCVCKIKAADFFGSGFFTKIEFNKKKINFLVTNNHVIQKENSPKYEEKILIYIKNQQYTIEMDNSRIIYNNEDIDVAFIEIKNGEIDCSYLEIDEKDLENKIDNLKLDYKKKPVYIIQNLNDSGPFVSYGIIKGLNESQNIMHFCDTKFGSSGSPILSLDTLKIIGIHKGCHNNNFKFNIGILMKNAVEEFKKFQIINKNNNNFNFNYNNKTVFKPSFKNNNKNPNNDKENVAFNYPIKINKMNSVNIQYLINENDEGINLFGKEFVNNNKENCILTFNNKDYELCNYIKFDEYKINKNEDVFEVVLKEKKKITNMSNMFNGCESLICISNIDKWDTQNVTNMSKMFMLCSSLCSLPYSLNWNTSKVIDISYMFNGCTNLSDIPDISKWDISNVNNMQGLFKYCESLKSLPDISNWNTSNVINMSEIFCCCKSLTKLPDISKWEIKNVMKMRDMFFCCENLPSIPNISNWNTINVIDMYHMFGGCKSLKSLPNISKWNTKKCKNENKDIFYKCNKELIKNIKIYNSFYN